MKRWIPVYVLLGILIGTLIVSVFRLTQHLAVIQGELAGIRREQVKGTVGRPDRSEPFMPVMVVNSPTVRIDETIDVNVTNNSLDVDVRNISPIPVEIDR